MKITFDIPRKPLAEEWKDIPRYEGKYQASNTGKIRSVNYNHTGKPKELKPFIDRYGYKCVALHKNKSQKTYTVHKLVAVTWITTWDDYMTIDHIDCNKLNNEITNLENVTLLENLRREWDETKDIRKRDSLGRFVRKEVMISDT